jgi:5-methylcytosine-specific restriction endonuclease McrA
MPTKVPCAECGTLMARGKGSLPIGEATCQPCRRMRFTKNCPDCDVTIHSSRARCKPCAQTRRAALAEARANKPKDPSYNQLRGSRWLKLRETVIYEEPLCTLGFPDICTGWSTTADHVTPRSKRPDLTLERSNLKGACQECNRARGNLPMASIIVGWAA